MKTKSKEKKPSERRTTESIARHAAEKQRRMNKKSTEAEKAEESSTKEVTQAQQPNANQSKAPVLNEDDQKKVVNQPTTDDKVTGEEK